MKSIKLSLAVLMLAAAFTACTKEEFAPTQDMQQGEFVGAKLIGSNLSMDFVREAETKVDANGNWVKGDEAGMAWIITGGNASSTQDPSTIPANTVSPVPYANHLFVMGDSDFTTYGNVYEGWHFGYYPYVYMPKQGVDMKVDMNPTQKDEYDVDQYKTRLHLSARQFLTAEDNLVGRQLVNSHMKLRRAVKTIKVKVKPETAIKNSTALQDLAITGVSLQTVSLTQGVAPAQPFYVNYVTESQTEVKGTSLNLSKLTPIQFDLEGDETYSDKITEEAFYNSLMDVWTRNSEGKGAQLSNKLTTTVDNDNINLSDDQVVRFYTLPNSSANFEAEELKVVVSVEAGEFVVVYVDPEDEDYDENVDGKNNEYLEKLATAYNAEKGYMHSFTKDNDMQVLGLEFVLTGDMFRTKFDAISSEKEWNKAVEMVDALGLEATEFKIVKKGTAKWQFTDEDKDGNLINLPETAELTVIGENIILNKANAVWPNSENFVIKTNIEVRANLTVDGVMNVSEGNTIYNGAVITAGPEAEIGVESDTDSKRTFANYLPKSVSGLTTKNGTVNVQYGAYVYPKDGYEYTIAYVVESASPTEILKVNRLIGINSTIGLANVNTLIIKTELDLNALAVEGIETDDRYEVNGIDGRTLTHLTGTVNGVAHNILVKLEGGSLVHKLTGNNTKVGEIIAVSGVNTLDDIIVTGDITVNEGATLNITNTETDLPKTYFYGDHNVNFTEGYRPGNIYNNGTLNATNVSLNLADGIENAGSLTVTDGDIWYTSSIENTGSQKGNIKAGLTSSFVVNSEDGFKDVISMIPSTATVKNTVVKLADDLKIKEEIAVTGKKFTLNLNGKTIENKTKIGTSHVGSTCYAIRAYDGAEIKINGNGTVNASGKAYYTIAVWAKGNNTVITIENGNFYNSGDGCDLVYASDGGKVVINGGTFKATKKVGAEPGTQNEYTALNLKDKSGASIEVFGGSYYKFDPSSNKSEYPPMNFLYNHGERFTDSDTGDDYKYISEKDGDWYVVRKVAL